MSKAVTPTFFTSHNVFFGNPQFPTGHYQVRLRGVLARTPPARSILTITVPLRYRRRCDSARWSASGRGEIETN